MSDSSCSNCDKVCIYRDFSYNCYVNSIKEVQSVLDKHDINDLRKIKNKMDKVFEITYSEAIKMCSDSIGEVIDLYEGSSS